MSTTFQDTIFELAKATTEAAQTAYQSGFAAGHHQGFIDGMRKAQDMLKESMHKEQEQIIEGGA